MLFHWTVLTDEELWRPESQKANNSLWWLLTTGNWMSYCCHVDRLTLTELSILGDHLAVAAVAVTGIGAIAVYTVALSFTWLIVTLIHIYNGRQGRKVEEIKWNTTPQPNFARRDCSLSKPWLWSFLTVQSFLSDGPKPNWGRVRLQPRPSQWGKGSRRGSSLDCLSAVVRHCGAGQHKQTDPFHFGSLHFSRLLCNVWCCGLDCAEKMTDRAAGIKVLCVAFLCVSLC